MIQSLLYNCSSLLLMFLLLLFLIVPFLFMIILILMKGRIFVNDKITLGVYAIRDVKTTFLTPTFEANDEVAQRNFEHAVEQSESILMSHAPDFSLYRLGTYYPETGRIEPYELPQFLIGAADCIV